MRAPLCIALGLLAGCASSQAGRSVAESSPEPEAAPPPKASPETATDKPAPWTQQFPIGSELHAAAIDNEGSLVLVPSLSESSSVWNLSMEAGVSLVKIGSSGTVTWSQLLTSNREAFVHDLRVTESGSYLIAGSFAGMLHIDSATLTSHGDRDAFVAALDSAGRLQWMHGFGGPARETALRIAIDADERHIAIGGWAESSFSFGGKTLPARGTAKDGFVAVYRAGGQPLWAHRIKGVGVDRVDALAYDNDELVILGSFSSAIRSELGQLSSEGERDIFCQRYDDEGTALWQMSWGSDQFDQGVAMAISESGEIAILALSKGDMTIGDKKLPALGESDPVLLWVDDTGTVTASARFGGAGDEVPRDLHLDLDGNLVVVGSSIGESKLGADIVRGGHEKRAFALQVNAMLHSTGTERFARGTIHRVYRRRQSTLVVGSNNQQSFVRYER